MDDWPDEIQDIWNNFAAVLNENEYADFLDEGSDLFAQGWLDKDNDASEAARDEFFDLMAEYDLGAELFDWDSWRDWYETA